MPSVINLPAPFDRYSVSSDGYIFDGNHALHCNNKQRRVWLTPSEGPRKLFTLPKLLLETFKGPIPDGYRLGYRDGNSYNFELTNLYFKRTGEPSPRKPKNPEPKPTPRPRRELGVEYRTLPAPHDRYTVTSDGRIFSGAKQMSCKSDRRQIALAAKRDSKVISLAKLILETFKGPPPKAHKGPKNKDGKSLAKLAYRDGNRHNLNLDNLYYRRKL